MVQRRQFSFHDCFFGTPKTFSLLDPKGQLAFQLHCWDPSGCTRICMVGIMEIWLQGAKKEIEVV